jgi:hypothetical protein
MDCSEHMRHRTARPFTVEVKSRKRRFPQFFAALQEIDRTVGKQNTFELSSEIKTADAGKTAEVSWPSDIILKSVTNPPEMTTSALEVRLGTASAEQQARRILPDLSWQEPAEVLLRERAEEQATRRRQPCVPRKRNTRPVTDAIAAQRPDQEVIQPKKAVERDVVVGQIRVGMTGKNTSALTTSRGSPSAVTGQRAATPSLCRSLPARVRRRTLPRWLRRAWVDRVAYRRAQRRGRLVRLRAEDRWKRRLSSP